MFNKFGVKLLDLEFRLICLIFFTSFLLHFILFHILFSKCDVKNVTCYIDITANITWRYIAVEWKYLVIIYFTVQNTIERLLTTRIFTFIKSTYCECYVNFQTHWLELIFRLPLILGVRNWPGTIICHYKL